MNPEPAPEKNIVIISGPAGSGKDTVIDLALKDIPFEKIITTTSRPRRSNEIEGREYYFLSTEEFQKRIEENKFVEYSQNENGAYYGVEQKHLSEAFARGKKLLWKVDWKGVLNIKKIYPGIQSIGIMASREALAERVRSREGSSYTEEYFLQRTTYAEDYFTHMSDHDYIIWNENGQITESVQKFKELLTKITSA